MADWTGQSMFEDATSATNVAAYRFSGTDYTVSYAWEAATPHVEVEGSVKTNAKGIHPRLYFKYLKSKLSMLEQRTFKQRMEKLEKLVDEFTKTGQEAMSESCIKQFLTLSREAAIYACGFKKFITDEHVDKFRYAMRNCSLQITPLKNFARVLPKKVAALARGCIEKKLFDDYVVFHLDNKGHKETEKERIERKRDPILFGKLENSEKLYYIIDWEDSEDDLRFSDIVEKLALKGEDITLSRSPKFEEDEDESK